ncbi:MAG: hypothetical protein ACK5EE_03010 [Ignavibacteria bacterium]|jgi:hypothetical protein
MREITTLATLEGRSIIRDIFRDLRFERQMSSLSATLLLWRICTKEQDLKRFSSLDIHVMYPLGIISGTSLWLQEIINRFFYSTINSFVYFGAAILLVTVGLRRIYESIPDWVIAVSISIEAILLATMFFIMYFSPLDEESTNEQGDIERNKEVTLLLREVGEISREYAAMAVRLEQVTDTMREMSARQEALISTTRDSVQIASQAVAPNPELIAVMQQTGEQFKQFNAIVASLMNAAQELRKEEIEFAVRRELEKIIADTVAKGYVEKGK